jgi:ribosomal protein L7/L12
MRDGAPLEAHNPELLAMFALFVVGHYNKVAFMKAVRHYTGLSLYDAKQLVEQFETVLGRAAASSRVAADEFNQHDVTKL